MKKSPAAQPWITRAELNPKEGWSGGIEGTISWHTLFSKGVSPTDTMNAGIAVLEPEDTFMIHSHPQAEIYFMLEGDGTLHLDGKEHKVRPGDAIFIPGNMDHGMYNGGSIPMRWFYVFATDSFSQVNYTFKRPALPALDGEGASE